MDGRRFDNLARTLATTPTRRGMLRLLAGGLLAGLWPARVRAADCSPACWPGYKCCGNRCCTDDAVCCGGDCCYSPGICCGSAAPGEGLCLSPDQTCCFNEWGPTFCPGWHPDEECCPIGRGSCCPPGTTCCGRDRFGYPRCCRADQACIDTDPDNSNWACVCPEGQTTCNDDGVLACVDLQTDPKHCSACRNACDPGTAGPEVVPEICQDGRCVCPTGYTFCPGEGCVNLMTSHDSCGSCENLCAGDLECIEGTCACPAGLTRCDDFGFGECADLTSSVEHCGACGNQCGGGATCRGGECRCPKGEKPCRSRESSGTALTVCCKPDWDCRKGRCCKVRGEECKRNSQCCSGKCRRWKSFAGGWQKLCR